MATWKVFAAADPGMAEAGRRLIYQFGPGLAFLATVRADGAPRLHPLCPVVTEEGLFAFVVPSPKRGDLRRDGRYAMHSYPPDALEDEFTVSGRAVEVADAGRRAEIEGRYRAEVGDDPNLVTFALFELGIERAMLATYTERGAWPPTYTVWRAPTATTTFDAPL